MDHSQVQKEASSQMLLLFFRTALNPFRKVLWNALCFASDELFQELCVMLSFFQANFQMQFKELFVSTTFKPIAQFLNKTSLNCRAVYNFVAVNLVDLNWVQQIHERCLNYLEDFMNRQVFVGFGAWVDCRSRLGSSRK